MTERIGNVLYWLCSGIAVVLLLAVAVGIFSPYSDQGARLVACIIGLPLAFLIWLAGRAGKYIFVGL